MIQVKAPLIGISRHRLVADGAGVTSLVGLHGCPLRCRYCINRRYLGTDALVEWVSPQQLVDRLMVDNLYFLATGGGVTLGGGEPGLHSEFMAEFRKAAPERWKITVETSLCVERRALERLLPVVDHYIIDIKDMNAGIYHDYTGRDAADKVADNLRWLLGHEGMAGHITVRVPHIPGFNREPDVERSIAVLREMGVENIDEFHYVMPETAE